MNRTTLLALVVLLGTIACRSTDGQATPVSDSSTAYTATPGSLGLRYDSVNIKTADEVRLTGWLLSPDSVQSEAILIIAGGDAGNMGYLVESARFIMSRTGSRLLLFDYRGFGSSDPFPRDRDRLTEPEFVQDIHAAVDWARERFPRSAVVLHGLSMGASLSLVAASDRNDIAGVIAESPYITQHSLVERLNARRRSQGSTRTITYIGGDSLDPQTRLRNLRSTPLLLIHGQGETNVPPEEIEAFFNNYAAVDRELWLVPGAGHLEALNVAPEEYAGRIQKFFSRVGR